MKSKKIKIRIRVNSFGHIVACPISPTVSKKIAASNQYDGNAELLLQSDYDCKTFLSGLPKAIRKDVQNGWPIVVLIDEWHYRHMVGGQSD